MHRTQLTTIVATLSLMAAPGVAFAAGHGNDHPTGSKAKAYGTYCKDESKKHVAGQSGTPFSQCVTAMAKLDSGESSNPTSACKALSKKHVAGQPGTPFSQCVKAAAKLKRRRPRTRPRPIARRRPIPLPRRQHLRPRIPRGATRRRALRAAPRTPPLRRTRCRPPATRAPRCPSGTETA